jgi:hypothetical protein
MTARFGTTPGTSARQMMLNVTAPMPEGVGFQAAGA